MVLALLFPGVSQAQTISNVQDSSLTSQEQSRMGGAVQEYNEAYFVLKHLNRGLPPLDTIPNQQTPQATMEYFVLQARQGHFDKAARMLNLNLIPDKQQPKVAAGLAERLHHILENETGINWDNLPDRPDGLVTIPSINTGSPKLVGKPLRSYLLGGLTLQDRDVDLRLQRVKVGDESPVWVFSPNTVENIDPLYRVYGPSQLARSLPGWASATVLGMPLWKWLVFIVISLIAFGVAKLARALTYRATGWLHQYWVSEVASRVATPVAVLVGIGVFFMISYFSQTYIGPVSSYFSGTLWVAIVIAVTWLLMRIIRYFSEYAAQQHSERTANQDKEENRSYLTYLSVIQRVLIFVVFVVGMSVVLTQFRPLKVLGVSLLSSVGVISVIFGIAAQSTLGNIIAGIQIAITRPVRIGDAVLHENNWGWVEDITYTYLLIRTWDQRRVIVPLKYFITNPVENWSMKDPGITRSIYLYADYRIDVRKVRKKYEELYEQAEEWDDRMPPIVQVTAVKEETLEIRLLCSAQDSSVSWNLHCRLREEMMRYIVELEDGAHLTKRRVKLENQLAHLDESPHSVERSDWSQRN